MALWICTEVVGREQVQKVGWACGGYDYGRVVLHLTSASSDSWSVPKRDLNKAFGSPMGCSFSPMSSSRSSCGRSRITAVGPQLAPAPSLARALASVKRRLVRLKAQGGGCVGRVASEDGRPLQRAGAHVRQQHAIAVELHDDGTVLVLDGAEQVEHVVGGGGGGVEEEVEGGVGGDGGGGLEAAVAGVGCHLQRRQHIVARRGYGALHAKRAGAGGCEGGKRKEQRCGGDLAARHDGGGGGRVAR
ncbi:hypothetical protein FGB62_63g01 [Gracilaria domingensis]|nr:hypothetical protein FGB62_63g01 [Gracilaria domingensis]